MKNLLKKKARIDFGLTSDPKNIWYDWGFFEIKAFKKGTMHFKFKNINDWYLLNKAYGELKGFTLSEAYKK